MRYVLPIVLSLAGFVAGYLLTPASDPSPRAALAAAADERAPAITFEQVQPGTCPMGLAPEDCCGSTTCQVTAVDGACPLGLAGCGSATQAACNAAASGEPAAATCSVAAPGCGGDPTICSQSGCAAAMPAEVEPTASAADQSVPLDDR